MQRMLVLAVGVFLVTAPVFAGGTVRAAPAPLLAAGIPAFAALGGAVGIARLVKRFRRRT